MMFIVLTEDSSSDATWVGYYYQGEQSRIVKFDSPVEAIKFHAIATMKWTLLPATVRAAMKRQERRVSVYLKMADPDEFERVNRGSVGEWLSKIHLRYNTCTLNNV